MNKIAATDQVVVIGTGPAAAQLAISLPQHGFSDEIPMVSDEPHLPYQRPPLSKNFLSERFEAVGLPASKRFAVEYRRNGRLIAVDAVNEPRAHMTARRRIVDETSTNPAPMGVA